MNDSIVTAAAKDGSNLFLLEDIEDPDKTKRLTSTDRNALRSVSDWIWTFIARPHKDLGRSGPVCPFVPKALERKTLWLAPERVADGNFQDVVSSIEAHKSAFLDRQPRDGDGIEYKSLVVVLTDLPADCAKPFFDDVLQQLAVPSYANEGLVLGAFYPRNLGSAIRNPDFRPFSPPVSFLLVRHAVIHDWMFFLDSKEWLELWARRFGAAAVETLAEELRRLPWRARPGEAGNHAEIMAKNAR